jgi:hypothetical protein
MGSPERRGHLALRRLKTCGHMATGMGSPERSGPAEAEILRFE